jgi:hypothetical protein
LLQSGTVFLLLSLCFVVLVEAQSSIWSQTYGGTEGDWATAVAEASDGGYVIVGYTQSFGISDYAFLLVKTDMYGNVMWNRTYGGADIDMASSVIAVSTGGYALAGSTSSFGAGETDGWLIKTDNQGNTEWNTTIGGTSYDYVNSLIETSDGCFVLAGQTYSFGAGTDDFWLIKVDSDGNVLWNKTYGTDDPDYALCVIETSDMGYALVGDKKTIPEGVDPRNIPEDCWLVKTDSDGNMQWNKTYAETYSDRAWSLVQTTDGEYVFAGSTNSFGAGGYDFWLTKTDDQGNAVWNKTYGGADEDWGAALVKSSDGGYTIAGYTKSFGAGDRDFWLVKTDADGNLEWNQTYGGTEYDVANALITTSNGGYAIAGDTESFGTEGGNFWLLVSDSHGVIPEFQPWLVLPMLLTLILAVTIYKKRLIHKNTLL